MRLICPNCGAQYSVDARVIPEGGRDVQCSSCRHIWFQPPFEAGGDAAATPSAPSETRTASETGKTAAAHPIAADSESRAPHEHADFFAFHPVEERGSAESRTEADDTTPPEEAAPDQTQPAHDRDLAENGSEDERPLPRRRVDPMVMAILREEADRERAARDAERDGSAQTSAPATEKIAATEPSAPPKAPREPRPAIETARPHQLVDPTPSIAAPAPTQPVDAAEIAPPTAPPARGFRNGFLVATGVFAALTLVYLGAPRIVGTFPGLEAPLAAYVDSVDSGRVWLDRSLRTVQKANGSDS